MASLTQKIKQIGIWIGTGAIAGIMIISGVVQFSKTKVVLTDAQIDSLTRVPTYIIPVGGAKGKERIYGFSCTFPSDTVKMNIPLDTVYGDTIIRSFFFDMYLTVAGKKLALINGVEIDHGANFDFTNLDSSVTEFKGVVKTDADTVWIQKGRPFYMRKKDQRHAHVRFDVAFANYSITKFDLTGFTATRTGTYGM